MAGLRLAADLPIGQLEPFAAAGGATAAAAPVRHVTWGSGEPVYAGPGWVGGRWRQVESRRDEAGYLLRIEAAGEFAVRADGSEIVSRVPLPGEVLAEETAAAVLGPCLMLALALRGIWCLHAGAAGPAGAVVALAGASGAGKSTLAAQLAATEGWRRVADDLLLVRLEAGGASLLPRFPQPSLPPSEQWLETGEPPLTAVYLLEPGEVEIEMEELDRRAAVLALVAQTVAARLFDGTLQALHLEFCAELAERLPVRRLSFRQRRDELPALVEAIVAAAQPGR